MDKKLLDENSQLRYQLDLCLARVAELDLITKQRDAADRAADKFREERDEARRVAVATFHNLGYFNWQEWTIHSEEISRYMKRTHPIIQEWEHKLKEIK